MRRQNERRLVIVARQMLGTLQLAVGSWIATLCFFVGGVVTARLIFQYFPK